MKKQRFKLTPAVYLVLRDGNKVLLSRRYNTGYMDGSYSMVAGHLEGDEPMRAALARETEEEAGITVRPEDMKLVQVAHLRSEVKGSSEDEYATFYFEASKYEGTPRIMEPNKCDDIQWFELDALPESMIPHVRLALENIKKGIDFYEYGW